MGLVLVTLVLAVAAGRALGGRLRRLEHLPYRGVPLLVGAVLALVAGSVLTLAGLPARPVYALGLVVAGGLALAFCRDSRAVHGVGLVAAGLLLNALMVLLNGGMPVSSAAAERAGVDARLAAADPRHVPVDSRTRLRPLADVIPAPLPFWPDVVSVGDVLVAAGLGQLVATGMLRRTVPPPGSPPAGAAAEALLAYRRRSDDPDPSGPRSGPEPPVPPVPPASVAPPSAPAGADVLAERRGPATDRRSVVPHPRPGNGATPAHGDEAGGPTGLNGVTGGNGGPVAGGPTGNVRLVPPAPRTPDSGDVPSPQRQDGRA